MKDLEVILSLAGTILGLVITILTFLVKLVRNGKAKKAMEQAVEIGNAVLSFIREAEKFTSYTGEEKKAYVMTKASQFALTKNISFNEAQISEKIEELVNLTKQVNTKSKAKEKAEIKKELEEVAVAIAKDSWL